MLQNLVLNAFFNYYLNKSVYFIGKAEFLEKPQIFSVIFFWYLSLILSWAYMGNFFVKDQLEIQIIIFFLSS